MTESQFYYNKHKLLGLCVDCGTNQAAPNRVRCKECLIKKRDRDRESKYQRKANAVLCGICIDCFAEPADRGYKTCQKCRDKNRNRLIQWCVNKSKD